MRCSLTRVWRKCIVVDSVCLSVWLTDWLTVWLIGQKGLEIKGALDDVNKTLPYVITNPQFKNWPHGARIFWDLLYMLTVCEWLELLKLDCNQSRVGKFFRGLTAMATEVILILILYLKTRNRRAWIKCKWQLRRKRKLQHIHKNYNMKRHQ